MLRIWPRARIIRTVEVFTNEPMIQNSTPEFEVLARDGVAPLSRSLIQFLDRYSVKHSVSGETVRLDASLDLLSEKEIAEAVGEDTQLTILRHTASTNNDVMAQLAEQGSHVRLCLSETQTAGKGRRGRKWISPFGRSIYYSMGIFVNKGLAELGGLSLLVGMQVVDVLREAGLTNVGLKWPNDVLLADGKLAGILVELRQRDERGIGAVIGIGINLAMDTDEASMIDQAWRSAEGKLRVPRNTLIAELTSKLILAIEEFEQKGFAGFAERWPGYNIYQNNRVRILRGADVIEGVDRGIDHDGNLRLQTLRGIEVHNSGEVSLRPAP